MSSSSQKNPRGRKSPNQRQKSEPQKSQPNASPSPTQPSQNQASSPKEPGMFQRVAETAAGVAVGSAIGNFVTAGVSSLFGSSSTPNSDSKSTPSSDKSENSCERERLNFVHCTEKENDLSKCEELQKEYKECRLKYNLP